VVDYKITFARSARKELESLDASVIKRVLPKVEMLMKEPRPKDCRKLKGEKNLWRIRVGDYRIIYAIYDKVQTVDIIAIRHRREAYQF